MKEVLLTIKSTQQVEDNNDGIELVTDGRYSYGDGVIELEYQESELTGFAGTTTHFHIENGCITLTRTGTLRSEMIFQEGRKHTFMYETDEGSMTMGIDTRRMLCDLDENGGDIEIYYTIDIGNVILSKNSFVINIK
jgi:uncharacterized beta-barrel protein YwiB (DUF1934 family)